MGLDNFWQLPEGKEEPVFKPKLRLCGGMFSSHGTGSFRGNVYNRFIEKVSGLSLYCNLSNNDVKRISIALCGSLAANEFYKYYKAEEFTEKEFEDLKRMFLTYADCGATLMAWY